jgi:hypothetical protein
MGTPSSAILSEVYLQHLEYTKIIKIITPHNIIGYFRYVNDILMIHDENSTDIHEVHTAFNDLAPMIKFTIEKETDNNLNFLDISIQNTGNKLLFNIYRKPTATDIIIPQDSCNPPAQKHAATRHLVNRMNSHKLDEDNRKTEQQIIEQIITNNGYKASISKHFNKPKPKIHTNNNKDSSAKFTYFGKETRFITKLFKETQIRIAYKVNNTIRKQLTPKVCNSNLQQQFEKSGVYSLT